MKRLRDRLVLFDIDNTLATSGGAGRRALSRAVVEVTGGARDGPGGPGSLDLPRVPYAGRTDPSILRDILGSLGVEPRRDLMDAVFARYVIHLGAEVATGRKGEVLPGVLETLDALSGRADVHLGVLTGNIARGAALKLAAHGLAGRFAFGAYGDDAEARPDLLPIALGRWREAAGRAGCAIEDVYVVGDTVHDVGVARAHGARAVAVGTGAPGQDREALIALRPDFFFEDLREAGPWLDEVIGGQ